MENYDSSFETKKHIETVGRYIDIISERFIKTRNFNEKIEELTLVDLLFYLNNGQFLANSDPSLASIFSNSYQMFSSSNELIGTLQNRKLLHDKSKLEDPEKREFDIWTPKLSSCVYGSEENKFYLTQLRKALEHHYANNRHHPEHFINLILGMNIIDITEMFCDWKASTERYKDGDIFKSIEINQERFGYGPQLAKVFRNTADSYFQTKYYKNIVVDNKSINIK